MTTRTDWSALRVHALDAQMRNPKSAALEAIAAAVVFSLIGALMAWRG